MPQTDMWAWLHSIPQRYPSSLDYSLSSPEQRRLEYTTFSELQERALNEVKSAYEALPHHLDVRFEEIDQNTLASFPEKADIATYRLVLGLSEHGYKGAYKPVYAYISKKNQVHQMLLRFGTKHLKPRDFDSVNWEQPFDAIYDAFGQSERAGDKISTLAAYYFLAAGHISEITTRTGGFLQNFIKLCSKMHVSSPTSQIEGNMNDGENSAQDLLLPLQHEKPHLKAQPNEEDLQNKPDTPDLKLIAVNYEVDNKGGQSTINPAGDYTSHVSSPTVWDGSDRSAARQPPSIHDTSFLEDACADRQKSQLKLQNPVEATVPATSDSKILSIDDLAAFVLQFKELKAENALLQQQQKDEATELRALLDRSKQDAKQAYKQAQDLQEKCLDNEVEMKKLGKQLAESLTQSAAKCKKLTYELGQEQWKARLAQHARDTMQTQLNAAQADKNDLERRLAKAEQDITSKEKLAATEAKLEALQAENQGMKSRIVSLNGEVEEEKNKFNDYKRKIRNLAMGT
ncbi:hypothetical protein SLS60_008307 [Paraconiothyrium brasiliense]|uniref:Uncharacterized protein n=1 Tax=Paraconiothyrium brasiliense TaxID=300254 RepID=A0ABR3R080_9PLEO